MKLVVGLGNPGKEYENTRHNVGFIVLDNYLKNETWSKDKDCYYKIINHNNEKVLFLKPTTYMNLSGNAVLRIANYYKIDPFDILVIHDDLDLKIGNFKLKFDSTAGGHNGIKSIIQNLNTTKFSRLKIGIGSDNNYDSRSYVLNKLSTKEIESLNSNRYIEIIDYFLDNGIEKTMNKYNTKGA